MPCRDYESDDWSNHNASREVAKLKQQADRLARMACAAMDELEANGIAEVLLLKNDELRTWWAAHKEADRKEKARIAEKERKERVKAEALARLSDEEKELLGLAKPKKQPRIPVTVTKSKWEGFIEEDYADDDWDAKIEMVDVPSTNQKMAIRKY